MIKAKFGRVILVGSVVALLGGPAQNPKTTREICIDDLFKFLISHAHEQSVFSNSGIGYQNLNWT